MERVRLADLVAVGIGSTLLVDPLSSVLAVGGSTTAVVELSLGMIPTFVVPLSVVLHLYSMAPLWEDSSPEPSETTQYRDAVQ